MGRIFLERNRQMLFITTSKIRYSTIDASFTVTFTVASEEINYLMDLHEKYMEVNLTGFKVLESTVNTTGESK